MQTSNTHKYSPLKIAQLKMWLEEMKEQGLTKFFEVFVDDFKIVPKTDAIQNLDAYEQYIDEDTQTIKVFIYNTPDSHRYSQRIFTMKEKTVQAPVQNQTMSGVEIQNTISEKVEQAKKEWDCEQTKKELEDTKRKLRESEEYAEKLTSRIETLKEKLENAKTMKEIVTAISEYGPVIFGGNPKPSATLSGAQAEKKPEEQASFKMKTEGEPSLSEQEKYFIEFGKSLRENFSQEEFTKILSIIDVFAKDKSNIDPVVSLLNINQQNKK